MTLILQDIVLNECRREKLRVNIQTTNDNFIAGIIRGFDNFTIIVDIDNETQVMIYKYNIVSIAPERPVLVDGYDKKENNA